MKQILHSTLAINISTEIDDDEASAETMEFLVKEDLEDLGYQVDDIQTLVFTKTEG
jgi:hypothetical protein